MNKQTFSFNVPAVATTNVVQGTHVLGIRSLNIAAPFDGRSLVYRAGEFSYKRDPYAGFLDLPAEELMSPICEALRQCGNFRAVAESGSALKPDLLVEINFSQLYGDFRQPDHPEAVMAVQFTFFKALNGIPTKAILQKNYLRRIPLKAPAAGALMAGWDQALSEILAEVSTDFRNTESKRAK